MPSNRRRPRPSEMRVIRTERLRLEPQLAAHAEAMFAVLSDPAIYEYENEPPPTLEWLRLRYTLLETRRSADGREQWLNWVVRLPTAALGGYVQATVFADGNADIAYEFASAHWGKGYAAEAMTAVMTELAQQHGVRKLRAVLRRQNHRSLRLLERLGFALATPAQHRAAELDADEMLMLRVAPWP